MQSDAGDRQATHWRGLPALGLVELPVDRAEDEPGGLGALAAQLLALVLFQRLEGSRPGLDVENPSRLSWALPRAAFVARYGVDPFGGAPVTSRDQVRAVPALLRGRLAVPVADFPEYLERVPRVAP